MNNNIQTITTGQTLPCIQHGKQDNPKKVMENDDFPE